MENVIDRTNRFYIEMSRKLLSKMEYDLLEKLLIEKITLRQAAEQYDIKEEFVVDLYERTCSKVKMVTELISEIDHYQKKLQELKAELNPDPSLAAIRKEKAKKDRQKLLYSSYFPFSRRMFRLFEALDNKTVGELAEIPLMDFHHFRGFKKQSKTELIAFIEFENIQYLFKGFAVWKKQPIVRFK